MEPASPGERGVERAFGGVEEARIRQGIEVYNLSNGEPG